MHMHWSDAAPSNPGEVSVANDYLGSPFSSAVNDVFWMLHGWIDDRIAQWERVNGQSANLSAWMGRMPPRPTTLSMDSMAPSGPSDVSVAMPSGEGDAPDPITHQLWLDYRDQLLAWTFPGLTEAEFNDMFPSADMLPANPPNIA
jgi:hypothetical protein